MRFSREHSRSSDLSPSDHSESSTDKSPSQSVIAQAARHLSQVAGAISTWWKSISGLFSPKSPVPTDAEEIVDALEEYDGQLSREERSLVRELEVAQGLASTTCAEWAIAQANLDKRKTAAMVAANAEKRHRSEQLNREHELVVEIADLSQRLDGTSRKLTDPVADLAYYEEVSAQVQGRADRHERRLAKLDAKIRKATDPLARERLETRYQTIATERRAVLAQLEVLSDLWVPWAETEVIDGVVCSPMGLLAEVAESPWGPATVIGAGGSLSEVNWSIADQAIVEATRILSAQMPARQPGAQRRHVAHLVIAMPHRDGHVPVALTHPTAIRMVRHALLSQGADPDLHDWVAVLHRRRKALGDAKDEEAVHVLWSRVRVDGAYLTNDNALIAAVVGRARWDSLAGIDIARIGIPRRKHACVRAGIRGLWDRSLSAVIQLPNGGMRQEISLLDNAFRTRLGAEGRPEPLICAGTWTPKSCYRTEKEIRKILTHLYAGD